jgi:phage-related protein
MTSWPVVFYSDRVESEIASLSPGFVARFVARFIRYAERMEIYGPDLGMPHIKAMGDGLFELRLKSGEGIARVFYCTRIGRRIVMLHHFIKKTEKTPAKELLIARTRMKEIENGSHT